MFRSHDELPTESPLPPGQYQHQEAGLVGGMLCVDLPGNYVEHEDWPAVRQLVHMLAEFINRIVSLENSLDCQQRKQETVQKFLCLVSKRHTAEESLPRLLQLATEISDSDGAAIFLLAMENSELNLCSQTSTTPMNFRLTRRPLSSESPDVIAGIKGATEVLLSDNRSHQIWLPQEWEQGICLPLRIGTSPMGSLWVYRREQERVSRDAREALEQIAGVMSVELERIALLEESTERFRLKKELRAAAHRPFAPSKKTTRDQLLKVTQRHESRQPIGGDFCKVMPIDDERTALMIGDATGDSIPAAMIRAQAEGAIQYSLMHAEIDPEETDLLMENINRSLCELLSGDHFFSLFLGIWNERTRELFCTNAGHPAPIILKQGRITEIKSHGMLLGILPASQYTSSKVILQPGDQLIAFSDGIGESIAQSRYGSIRQLIERATLQERYQSRESLADLLWETAIFSDHHQDDRSLLVAEVSQETALTSLDNLHRSPYHRRVHPDHSPRYHGNPHGRSVLPDDSAVSCESERDVVNPLD